MNESWIPTFLNKLPLKTSEMISPFYLLYEVQKGFSELGTLHSIYFDGKRRNTVPYR
jgi:hypothetical protein